VHAVSRADGDLRAAAGLAEDGGDLLHHLQARVEDLPLVVARVVAVLADEQDALDRQLVAGRQGVGDGARDLDAELPADRAGQVVVRRLIDVEGVDVVPGDVQLAAAGVAEDEAAGDVVGVRHRPVDGADDRDGLAPLLARRPRPGAKRLRRARLPLSSTRRNASG